MESGLRISALALRTGTTAPTIRYYEEIGLLPMAERQDGGQRRYADADVRRLTFVRRCRDFGFSIDQVRALVALLDNQSRRCSDVRDIGHAHLVSLRAKLSELRALERMMVDFVRSCDETCVGGVGADCVPLVRLAAPRVASERRRSRSAATWPATRATQRESTSAH